MICRRALALVLLASLGAAGCYGDDEGLPQPTPVAPAPTATSTATQAALPATPTATRSIGVPTATPTATHSPTGFARFSGAYVSSFTLSGEREASLHFAVELDGGITGTLVISTVEGDEVRILTGSANAQGDFILSGEGVDLAGTLPLAPDGQGSVSGTVDGEPVGGIVIRLALPTATPTPDDEVSPTPTGLSPPSATPTSPTGATATPTPAEAVTPSPTPTPSAMTQPTGSPSPIALGVRELRAVRNGTLAESQLRGSAVDGFDIALDPWLPATFRLAAGPLDAGGVAELRLLEDVILGFPLLDGSVACFLFVAEGSVGELACHPGGGRSLLVAAAPGGMTLETAPEPSSPAGSAYLAFRRGFQHLPNGSSPNQCLGAGFADPESAAWTTGATAAALTDPSLGGEVRLEADGEPFDCARWNDPNGPGVVVHPLIGSDPSTLVGHGAVNLLLIRGGD